MTETDPVFKPLCLTKLNRWKMSKIIALFIVTNHCQKHLELEKRNVKNNGMKALTNPADMSTNGVIINQTIFPLQKETPHKCNKHYSNPCKITSLMAGLSKQLQYKTNL
jgi:hypothetical protein